MMGIIGRKLGMTQIFNEDGTIVPVTLIKAGPCCVVQVKTSDRDGYEAVKLGFEEIKKEKRINRPLKGVFEKADVKPYKFLKEYKIDGLKVGDMVTVEGFSPGEKVTVSGISKGKGFQGVMKRYNYSGGPGSHGSMFHRAPGSIGQSASPSRVWKNKGMPGRMGSKRASIRNLTIVEVKPDQDLLIVQGAVPGPTGNIVEIKRNS